MSPLSILQAPPEVINQYLSQLSDEELAQLGLTPRGQGAPADFGGAVFPNPDNLRVSEDTESGEEPTKLPAGVNFRRENFSGEMPRDVSNPPRAQILPTAAKSSPVPQFDPDAYENEQRGAAPAFNPDEYEQERAAKSAAETKSAVPWLDREIPLTDYSNATLSGLQSIGRGLRDAGRGLYDTFLKPPEKEEKSIGLIGPAAVPLYRMLRGLGHTAEDSLQAIDAIKDINASEDPAGTYLKVAQETAGQGAGQALLALATEGAVRGVPPTAKAAGKVAGKVREAVPAVVKGVSRAVRAVDPDVVGIVSPRAAHSLKVAQRAAKVAEKYAKPVPESANVPETLIDDLEGVTSPQTEAAAALEPEAMPVETAPAPTPAEILTKRGTPAELQQLLEQSLGGKALEKGVPLRSQGKAPALPEGYTPVESSLLKGVKYDPATETFHGITDKGEHYAHAGVTPEDFANFQNTPSKGTAWNELRKRPGVVQVEKNFKPTRPGTMRNDAGEVIPKSKAGMQSPVMEKAERLGEFIREKPPAKTSAKAPVSDYEPVDLLGQLKESLAQTKGGKGSVFTSAEPEALMKRWGVDEESLASGRGQTRGMSPGQVEAEISKLVEHYKKGGPIEPILETRDAANNLIDVDGRMRVIAAKRAGIKRIPIVVRRIGAAKAGD